MTSVWLRCEIVKGMFSDEVTIVVQSHDGEVISAFVPKDRVEEKESRVSVRVFEDKCGKFAVLPNESQTVISIKESELVAA